MQRTGVLDSNNNVCFFLSISARESRLGLSGGAIAGVVISVVIVIALVAFLIIFLKRRGVVKPPLLKRSTSAGLGFDNALYDRNGDVSVNPNAGASFA